MSEEQDHYSSIAERCARCSMSSGPGSGSRCPSLIHLYKPVFLSVLSSKHWFVFAITSFSVTPSHLTHIHLTLSGQRTHPFYPPYTLVLKGLSKSITSLHSICHLAVPYKRTDAGTLACLPLPTLQPSLYLQDSRGGFNGSTLRAS